MAGARRSLVWVTAIGVAFGATATAAQMPLVTRLSTLQNPRGLDWHRIDSPHFTVIYPDSMAEEAQRATDLLEQYYARLGHSLRARPERIPVVLNNQSMTSNAYVAWAPRRTQWYALPNTTVDALGPMDWYRLLAMHEGRHVVQERAVRAGWTGLASRLFGENTTALLGGTLYYPAWFWEGDAVGTETALSDGGRGRQPGFTGRTRALAAAGAPNDYYPAWQGSYRTLLPNWYEQGYLITTYVRRHHGDSAWSRAIKGSAWNPLPPFALSMALKRITGSTLPQLHRLAVSELDSMARAERAVVRETPATVKSPEVAGGGYREWSQPQYAADGSIIATYFDLDTPPQLVRLRDGRKEVLASRTGIVGDLQFHIRGDRVVWSEYEVDPRYGERNYLVVKRLDLSTGAVTRLTDRSRYYGASLSPDGKEIAVVHFSLSRRATLAILDAESGRELRRLANDRGYHLVTPTWAPDGKALYVVAVDTLRGNSLERVSLMDGGWRTIVGFTHDAISRPVAAGQWILFGSTRSGIDNVWAADTATGARYQVTSRSLGAYTPSTLQRDGETRLLFADLTPSGYDVAEARLDSSQWVPEEQVPAHRFPWAEELARQEAALDTAGRAIVPDREAAREAGDSSRWPSRPFGGWSRLFDFHSLVLAPTSDGANTGLVLESRNLLNTFGFSIGASFDGTEGTSALEVGASYAGLPVILDGAMRLGSRASTYTDTAGAVHAFSWHERSMSAALRLPFTRVSGLTRQSVSLTAGIGMTHISDQPVAFRFDNNNGTFAPVNYGMRASHTRASAYRDLFATGAAASMSYRHTPVSADYRGRQLSLAGALFSKGAFRNHALILDAAHEERRTGNFRFDSDISFPRGFRRRYHERLAKAGATYHAPLWYPDLAIGPIVYARRVQGNVFADVARGSTRNGLLPADYRSLGAELTADLALLGTRTTTRIGVRWSKRLTGDKATVTELVLLLPQ